MLFNSIPFIFIFLPIVFVVYFTLTQNTLNYLAKYWLVAASLFFYSWWNVYFLPILVTSVLVNYATTRKIQSLQKHENNISDCFDLEKQYCFYFVSILIKKTPQTIRAGHYLP